MFGSSRSISIYRRVLFGDILTRSLAATSKNEIRVKHEPKKKQFFLNVDGKQATLNYRMRKKYIILEQTKVPQEMEGKGVGKLLVQCALTYVANNNLQMKVHCSFIDHYINKYAPEYKKYLAKPKNT